MLLGIPGISSGYENNTGASQNLNQSMLGRKGNCSIVISPQGKFLCLVFKHVQHKAQAVTSSCRFPIAKISWYNHDMKSPAAMNNLRSGGLPTSYLIEVLEEMKTGKREKPR